MAGTRTRKRAAGAANPVALAEPAPELEAAVARDLASLSATFRFEAWPTEHRVVTQWFGARPEFYGKYGLPGHEGIDFVAPLGSKIFAVAAGKIKRVQATDDGKAYGIHVRIQHVDGYETIYGHFKSAIVKLGDQVAAGQQIGYADSTGNSFGSHLHLTLKLASESLGRFPNHIVDPTPFVKALLELGKDGAAYVKDIITDGTQFPAGQAFEQNWSLRNTGTTAWGDGYALAYLSGDRLGGPPTIPVPPTNPGGLAEVKANFQAPAEAGRYRSVWQMLAPAKAGGVPAARFGERMWVDIVVPAVPVTVQPKELFESPAEQPEMAAVQAAWPHETGGLDTLADIIASFAGLGTGEIAAMATRLPLIAGLEVILRGHSVQLTRLAEGEDPQALTRWALDQIVALARRLDSR